MDLKARAKERLDKKEEEGLVGYISDRLQDVKEANEDIHKRQSDIKDHEANIEKANSGDYCLEIAGGNVGERGSVRLRKIR